MKIIFMGTPAFSADVLKALLKFHEVVLVVSQPDRIKDRKGNLVATCTKQVALDNNINVIQPEKISDAINLILNTDADIIITCAYGQFVPSILLNHFKYGSINVHASLLPKLRGGAPIQRAIMNGFNKTGITIMYMDKKMDAGDIITQRQIDIKIDDTYDSLSIKLSNLAKDLLLYTLDLIISNKINPIKQDENLVTYAYNIKKEEEKINFNNNAKDVVNLIKALCSNPGAYCILDNKRLKVYNAIVLDEISDDDAGVISYITKDGIVVNCKDVKIKLLDIKLEGKKRCLVKDYINGIKKEELVGRKLD